MSIFAVVMPNKPLVIYIASSFKHLHGVRLLGRELRRMGCEIMDWTQKAAPPPGLTPAERRQWMDTDREGGQVYEFCKSACQNSDLVIYFGESGQDAGVEIGLAAGSGVPILGIRGPLEGPGLMLHGAVDVWAETAEDALEIIQAVLCAPTPEIPGGASILKAAMERCKAEKTASRKELG